MYKTLDVEIYPPTNWTCPDCGYTTSIISKRAQHEYETKNDRSHQRNQYLPELRIRI